MRLVRNAASGTHKEALASVFEEAEEVTISVAFLKSAGAAAVCPLLHKRLQKGASARAFIGTDFFLTDPEALDDLLSLHEEDERFTVFLADQRPATFHPKVYVGRNKKRLRCLIGSANLTGGALGDNEELSALVECDLSDPFSVDLSSAWTDFEQGGRFQLLDRIVLEQYRSRHAKYEAVRRKIERETKFNDEPFDLRTLENFLSQYANSAERSALAKRRSDRREALIIQNQLADLSGKQLGAGTKARVGELARDLMTNNGGRHLWHSDAIYRRGLEALEHPRKVIEFFRAGREAASKHPIEGYEQVGLLARDIPGFGVNAITEMMATFAPERYAVFNGNTAGALAAIGISTPKGDINAKNYDRICAVIDRVRARINGLDFTDADAFLNFVYFRVKQQADSRRKTKKTNITP
jgi:HKD family nuclease